MGILEKIGRTPVANFRQSLKVPLVARSGVQDAETCLARADLPDLAGRPLYLEELHRRTPDAWRDGFAFSRFRYR